jgi:predicted nucleic acid-binding protein
MIVIKDSVALIHLAKLSLLSKSCQYWGKVIIPIGVYKEVLKGRQKGFGDVPFIEGLVEIKNQDLVKKVHQFNVQRGEAEAVALYWQEKADWLITDDDNVRKKKIVLNINVIGTPAIILRLYKEKHIDSRKVEASISELQKIGWFSTAVIDTMRMEVRK